MPRFPRQMDITDFQRGDIRVGVVASAAEATGLRTTAYELLIDFGSDLGTTCSIAQLINYSMESLQGRQVLAVVNLAPRQVGRYTSEVLTLGVPSADRGTALVIPEVEAILGGRVR